jgi:hypothetical protein
MHGKDACPTSIFSRLKHGNETVAAIMSPANSKIGAFMPVRKAPTSVLLAALPGICLSGCTTVNTVVTPTPDIATTP